MTDARRLTEGMQPMKRYGLVSATIAVLAVSYLTMAPSQAKPFDYDSLCKLDKAERLYAFMNTSPEIRTEMMKIHFSRVLDAYRGELTAEQNANIAELVATFTPEYYKDGPAGEQARQKAQKLTRQATELFTLAQIRQISVMENCFAPAPKR